MTEEVPSKTVPIGTTIVYFNQWTGFKTDRFRDQFQSLASVGIESLVKGAEIYVDVDPLHPQGKVYGYVKCRITAIEKDSDGTTVVSYQGGGFSGGRRITSEKGYMTLFRAVDEEALAKILEELPLATQV